jgi:hypothetical protein
MVSLFAIRCRCNSSRNAQTSRAIPLWKGLTHGRSWQATHARAPAILPSLLACDLAKLADEANRVAPSASDYVEAPPPFILQFHAATVAWFPGSSRAPFAPNFIVEGRTDGLHTGSCSWVPGIRFTWM